MLLMNDTMFRVLLLMMIKFDSLAKVVNLKTVFLYRELEEEIYMECPSGTKDVGNRDYIILQK